MRRPKGWIGCLGLCLALVLSAGCELQESTIVDVEDVVVAEVYVELGQGLFGQNRVIAFLHRTVGGLAPGFSEVPGPESRLSVPMDRPSSSRRRRSKPVRRRCRWRGLGRAIGSRRRCPRRSIRAILWN